MRQSGYKEEAYTHRHTQTRIAKKYGALKTEVEIFYDSSFIFPIIIRRGFKQKRYNYNRVVTEENKFDT